MMQLEKQLEHIVRKDDMHKWVDSLPEGSKEIIILSVPDDDGSSWMHYRYVGESTSADLLYCVKSFEHWLFRKVTE